MKHLIFLISVTFIFIFAGCQKCEDVEPLPCGGSSIKPKVDLIVLIDNSGSMNNISNAVNQATSSFKNGVLSCPSDLRVVYFGLAGTWPGTVFNQNHQLYLNSLHPTKTSWAANSNYVGYDQEQGANAIEDLSGFFDWRDKACRAIFYLSDEELDSFFPIGDYSNEDAVTNEAIVAANNNDVAVFNHFIDHQNRGSQIIKNYEDLADHTGGIHFYNTDPSIIDSSFYKALLPKILCNSCNACNLNDFTN